MDFDYIVIPALILLMGIAVIWLSLRRILALPTKVSRKWRRVVERIVLSIVIVVAVAVAGSASYNSIAMLWFRAHNPPPGANYMVDGYKMHIDCTGTGSPTIVLEAGLGNDALIWGGVQPVLAKTTRVCSYDRAGFGWSDARPGPRDADHIAAELHGLLAEAKVSGPIVLMGHSIAGIYMRDYATRYPEGLEGIVFVDGSTPMQQENPAFKAAPKGPPEWAMALLEKSMFIIGIPRLMGQCTQTMHGFEAHASRLQAEELCHAEISAAVAEMDNIGRSGQETVHTGPYGAVPILIFSHDPAKSLPKTNPPAWQVNMEKAWSQMQEDQLKLSTRSRGIIAKDSTHYIQLDRPELLEKEVPPFIEQIRGTAPQPANYGSTITE